MFLLSVGVEHPCRLLGSSSAAAHTHPEFPFGLAASPGHSGCLRSHAGSSPALGAALLLAQELLPEEPAVAGKQQVDVMQEPGCQPLFPATPCSRKRDLFAPGAVALLHGDSFLVSTLPGHASCLGAPRRDLLQPAAPPLCSVAFHCHSGCNAAS